jgi:hypothetical protein
MINSFISVCLLLHFFLFLFPEPYATRDGSYQIADLAGCIALMPAFIIYDTQPAGLLGEKLHVLIFGDFAMGGSPVWPEFHWKTAKNTGQWSFPNVVRTFTNVRASFHDIGKSFHNITQSFHNIVEIHVMLKNYFQRLRGDFPILKIRRPMLGSHFPISQNRFPILRNRSTNLRSHF